MYETGGYTYKSKEDYENMLLGIMLLLVASLGILFFYRENIDVFVLSLVSSLCVLLVFHLLLRWMGSKGYLVKRHKKEVNKSDLKE